MTLDTTTQTPPVSSNGINSVEQGGFTFASTEPIGDFSVLKGGPTAPTGDPKDPKAQPAEDAAAKETKEAEEGDAETPSAKSAKPSPAPSAAEIGKKGGEATAAIKRHQARVAAKTGDAPAKEEGEGEAEVEDDDPDTAGKKATEKVAAEIKAAPLGTKKKLASERVGEATREAKIARQELARERAVLQQERSAREQDRRELAELRQRVANPQPAAQPKQAPAPQPANGHGRPAAAEFDGADPSDAEPDESDPKYSGNWAPFFADHTKWTARKEARALIQRERSKDQTHSNAHKYAEGLVQYVKRFETRVRESISKDPELASRIPQFERVIQNSSYVLPEGQAPTAVQHINDSIIDSEHPAVVMAYLKSTPNEIRRMLSLRSRDAIAREMVKLEARLELMLEDAGDEGATAGTPPPAPAMSKANPPVRPVTGPPAVAEELSDKLSFDDYARNWDASVKPRIYKR